MRSRRPFRTQRGVARNVPGGFFKGVGVTGRKDRAAAEELGLETRDTQKAIGAASFRHGERDRTYQCTDKGYRPARRHGSDALAIHLPRRHRAPSRKTLSATEREGSTEHRRSGRRRSAERVRRGVVAAGERLRATGRRTEQDAGLLGERGRRSPARGRTAASGRGGWERRASPCGRTCPARRTGIEKRDPAAGFLGPTRPRLVDPKNATKRVEGSGAAEGG